MATDNPVLERLVPEMIENLIKIVVDQKLHGLNVESKFERIRVNRGCIPPNEKVDTDIICSHEKLTNDVDTVTLNSACASAISSGSETEQFKSALGTDIESSNPSGSESSSETTETKEDLNSSNDSNDPVKLELRRTEEHEAKTEKLEDKPIELDTEHEVQLRIRSSIESIPSEFQSISNSATDSRPGSPVYEAKVTKALENDSKSIEDDNTINRPCEGLQESSNPVSKIPITDSSLIQMLIS